MAVSQIAVAVKEKVAEVIVESAPEIAAIAEIDWDRKPVVIVGTGLAGYHLAREFRKQDSETPLIMLTADDGRFYSKPMISTAFAKAKQPDQLANSTAADMAEELQADIRIFSKVTEIDPELQVLKVGEDTIEYGKLVLASGAKCIEAPLTGDGLSRVYSVNDLLGYTRFRTAMVGKKKILIIGAGLIGSEYANDMIQSGFMIDVVEPMPNVLGTLLPEQAAHAVQESLEQAGVQYHFGTVVERVDKSGNGIKATLANGSVIEADAVLSAIGVRPDLTLASLSKLDTNRGILTDRSLQTSAKNIYALGDCAEVDGNLLFYVAPLMESARVLSKVLSDQQAQVHYGVMPVMVKTTLCPVVVSPPPRDAEGEWHVNDDGYNVLARYITSEGRLLGFALTGDATREKDALTAKTQPLMS
ncbi:FAD-dependent oxidoreductase [Thalassotalea fonticola]|uniref:FAD-dependent oxidoreductase n=2 Tax=Thalassotalea fonticola TaxID=3065649 RepID=A0ABZ0GU88_9GAMM|nr:FAD-dependent oxidoreductase [Colwelliaceae bacterium S1-1]